MDYESGLSNIIEEYKAGDKHRWAAAFAIEDLWLAFTERHEEIMAVLVTELNITDDQVYNLLHAAELAGLSESTRKLTETLSPSHFSRLCRAAVKYKLHQETVIEYLEAAAEHGLSAQALIEQVTAECDPDEQYLYHRTLRVVIRAVKKLLQMAEFNHLDGGIKVAAMALLEALEKKSPPD